MNKHEAIKKVEQMGEYERFVNELIPKLSILNILNQLYEPEKPVVPQFVAEWYEGNKTNLEYNIWEYIYNWDKQNVSQIKTWFDYSSNKPLQTLINMKQFGYEVEKEPKYTVKIKSTKCSTTPLVFSELTGAWFFSVAIYQGVRFKHTRKELEEAGFGWVFSCEGIEIEEIEE